MTDDEKLAIVEKIIAGLDGIESEEAITLMGAALCTLLYELPRDRRNHCYAAHMWTMEKMKLHSGSMKHDGP